MSDRREAIDGFNPRVVFPSGPVVKLSEKLNKLSQPARVSQRWMAAEVGKLVPESIKLEQNQIAYAVSAFTIGAVLGTVVGISV